LDVVVGIEVVVAVVQEVEVAEGFVAEVEFQEKKRHR